MPRSALKIAIGRRILVGEISNGSGSDRDRLLR